MRKQVYAEQHGQKMTEVGTEWGTMSAGFFPQVGTNFTEPNERRRTEVYRAGLSPSEETG